MLKKTVPNPHTPSLTRHQVSKFTEEKCGATETSDRKDDLSLLDSNEGYVTGLIGSPDTILDRIRAFRDAGIDMFHLQLGDSLFEQAVLPDMSRL